MNNGFSSKKYYHIMDSPIGSLRITQDDFGICEISFDQTNCSGTNKRTPLIDQTVQQLQEFFSGIRKNFSIKLSISGTDFQKKVWDTLQKIPYGETRTYEEIGKEINNPLAARAVGMANNKNRLPIIIPCHRVIGKNGKMVGYAGGLEIKEFLLNLERENKSNMEI